jgi:hypothetical protein
MSVDRDGLISHLIEITGCETDVAHDILEGADWNLSAAVSYLRDEPGGVRPAVNPEPVFEADASPRTQSGPPRRGKSRSPTVVSQIPSRSEGEVDVPGTNAKFRRARARARARAQGGHRWLLVYLTEIPLGRHSVLNSPAVKELIARHFVKLECSLMDPDGEWFSRNYVIPSAPCFTIIDPTTGETTAQREVAMDPPLLCNWLASYIADRRPHRDVPEPAKPAEEAVEVSDGDEDVEDKGNPVSITVEFPGDTATSMKRVRVDIGENERVGILYRKVASLIGRKDGNFKLVLALANVTEMTDRKKTIAEMDCAKALVRVMSKED